MTPDEIRPARLRRERAQARLAKHIRDGNWFVTLLAHESVRGVGEPHDNPPFVQYTWRDDLRLQIETQGDHYRDAPYEDVQIRILDELGYAAPFELGDEFCNRTILREAEGCHPESAAKLMLQTLWAVHGVHFHNYAMSVRHGVSHWSLEWRVNPSRIDIESALRARYTLN
jgi:hypothetical protein